MRAHWIIAVSLLLAAGCEEDKPGPGIETGECALPRGGEPTLEVSHYGAYGAIEDTVWCGIPPQGGAPYAPFGVRIRGLQPDKDGFVHTLMTATDTMSGEEVGLGDFNERFLCSNVGDNDGYWVSSEFHMRFYGQLIADLHDSEVELRFESSGPKETLTTTLVVTLDCLPGT